MSWLLEVKKRQSEKNGSITALRRFGKWTVYVNGCQQTGSEVHAMWKDAFKRVRRRSESGLIQKILMLGLGGGGEVKTLHEFFPDASLTVVEYDPEMITLAKELRLYRPFPFPQVICEDAKTALAKLYEQYDLIILDLFFGPEPSSLATDRSFLATVAGVLAPRGILVANVFRKTEYLSALAKSFDGYDTWRFKWNYLGLYRKSLEKKDGYVPRSAWPEFQPSLGIPPALHPSDMPHGAYWRTWPFSFEEYQGDQEPDIALLPKEKRVPIRVIMWERFWRTDAPPTWIKFIDRPYRKTGYTSLSPEYKKNWSATARRDLRKWEKDFLGSVYTIEPVTEEEFGAAYLQSTVPFYMRRAMKNEIGLRIKSGATPIILYGARRITDKKLIGGIALMSSPSLKISYFLAGFFLKEVSEHPVMTGLFDYWFSSSIAEGMRFLDFGNFWKKGEPASWKGFSAFKAKFGPTYFFYQPRLYRFSIFKQSFPRFRNDN
ncbi:MAG: class I SAM-dependent methyltransferase [Patescibacteria group bacterium]|nr:class I SAM-dependent methyltransferase [Patescibacteria group bacterium]